MQCTIKIHMDNAAFDVSDNGSELAGLLRAAAVRLDHRNLHPDDPGFAIVDRNGNKVGKVMFAP